MRPGECADTHMPTDRLITDFRAALDEEIAYLKNQGGDKKVACKNGVLIKEGGGRWIYEFLLEAPTAIDEDASISALHGADTVLGSIVQLEGLKIVIALTQDIGPRVAELVITANPYFLLELLKARLQDLEEGKIQCNAELALKVFGIAEPRLGKEAFVPGVGIDSLNPEQHDAISRALGSDTSFIWGPPGTGKTFVLAEIASQFLARNARVLIASHTNIAIDNALERLARSLRRQEDGRFNDGRVLRIGTPQLRDLFEKFPELDVEHWVEIKGRAHRERLAALRRDLEAVRASADRFQTVVGLFDEVATDEAKLALAHWKTAGLLEEIRGVERDIEILTIQEANLKAKLERARTTNVIIRVITGRTIGSLEHQIKTTSDRIAKNHSAAGIASHELDTAERDETECSKRLQSRRERLKSLLSGIGEIDRKTAQERVLRDNDRVNELTRLTSELQAELDKLEQCIISEAQIVGTTLTKVYLNEAIHRRQFDVVIVDEASTAPLPALYFCASLAATRVVVIGDFRQLAPIAGSKTPLVQKWLARDVFTQTGITEKVNRREPDPRLIELREQRRMPQEVADIVNEPIYGGMLRTGPKTADEQELEAVTLARRPFPGERIIICDTSSVNPWCTTSRARSPFNVYDAFLAVELAELATRDGLSDIGIITPYRAQSKLIHELVVDRDDLTVDPSSVHRFQGREKQLIIFDLVEGPVRTIKWLNGGEHSDAARLINVAVTRAKAKLIFLANLTYLRNALSDNSVLGRILDKARSLGRVVDSRELFEFIDIRNRRRAMEATDLDDGRTKPAMYSELYFYEQFRRDLARAAESVLIVSPYITSTRTTQFEEVFRELLGRNVKLSVVTKPIREQRGALEAISEEMTRELATLGIQVVFKPGAHEKLAIIDNRIIWHGSLNILSHRNTSEIMSRFPISPARAASVLRLCGINVAVIQAANELERRLNELNQRGVGSCPAGHRMVVKRSAQGVFLSCSEYPRCTARAEPDRSMLEEIYGAEYLRCEKCAKPMTTRFNRHNHHRFLGCSGYPGCDFTRPL